MTSYRDGDVLFDDEGRVFKLVEVTEENERTVLLGLALIANPPLEEPMTKEPQPIDFVADPEAWTRLPFGEIALVAHCMRIRVVYHTPERFHGRAIIVEAQWQPPVRDDAPFSDADHERVIELFTPMTQHVMKSNKSFPSPSGAPRWVIAAWSLPR